jgi:hypothetical protein
MVRFACPRIAAAFLACLVGVVNVSAQELPAATLREAARAAAVPTTSPAEINAASSGLVRQRRPGALVPLYVSFATLQILDTHSTSRALDRGAVEANPAMRGFAGNQIAMLAVKAAGTSGVIYASEKMWKKNKAAAVIFMMAANSAMAWVVQNNYRAVR